MIRYEEKPMRGGLMLISSRNTLALPQPWVPFYDSDVKPGLGPGALNALILCFPISSALWAAIIYAASKLIG